MNYINVETSQAEVIVNEENGVVTAITTPSARQVLTAVTEGPQGPAGSFPLNDTAKVDRSLIYYDAASSSYRAGSTWTTDTVVDGANF